MLTLIISVKGSKGQGVGTRTRIGNILTESERTFNHQQWRKLVTEHEIHG